MLFKLIKSDYLKYKKYGGHFLSIIFLTQGFWAILNYRISYYFHSLRVPILKQVLLFLCLIWKKMIEFSTGISIASKAKIGQSFYIGHFGNIIIHPKAFIGDNCNISQGVTIGISGRGGKRGVPKIGNNVYIGANATVVGKIIIEDKCIIGANSLMITNAEANSSYLGVPAKKINNNTSEGYI